MDQWIDEWVAVLCGNISTLARNYRWSGGGNGLSNIMYEIGMVEKEKCKEYFSRFLFDFIAPSNIYNYTFQNYANIKDD